jgi:4-hydroxybenzoate polyprenyltransferase
MIEMKVSMEKSYIKNNNRVFVFLTGFIRIRGVLNWTAISFFGFLLGISSLNIRSYMIPFFFFLVSTFFILAFTFAINNYYDIDTDRENPRRAHLNAIASGTISKHTAMVLNIIFIIIPLGLSVFYDLWVFVLCFLLIFWMWAYSAPPLRLKGRPGLDLVWHFIAFVALVLWGSYLAGSITVLNMLVALSLGIFGCIAQVDNHISDYSYDKASGSKTFAVWIGIDKAHTTLKMFIILYIIVLLPLIVLYSFQSLYTILILIGGISVGFFIVKIKRGPFVDSVYQFIIFFGGSVFLNCFISHINSLL